MDAESLRTGFIGFTMALLFIQPGSEMGAAVRSSSVSERQLLWLHNLFNALFAARRTVLQSPSYGKLLLAGLNLLSSSSPMSVFGRW
jgi:hypothetical protein